MSRSNVDVLIIGASIAGCSAALYGCTKSELSFGIIDMRDDPVRPQVLTNLDSIQSFLAEEMNIGLTQAQIDGWQIKDLERGLRKELQTHTDSGQLKQWIPYRVTAIDEDKREVVISPSDDPSQTQVIHFRYLLCADGAKRSSIALRGRCTTETHRLRDIQPPNPHAIVAQFSIQTHRLIETGPIHFIDDSEVVTTLASLRTMPDPDRSGHVLPAWQKSHLPTAVSIFTDMKMDHKKIAIGCDAPDIIQQEKDPSRRQRLIRTWCRQLIATIHNIKIDPKFRVPGLIAKPEWFADVPASRKHADSNKDRLRTAYFKVVLDEMKKPVTLLPAGAEHDQPGAIIAIGDHLITPYFYKAYGVVSALASAKAAIDVLADPDQLASQFEAAYQLLRQTIIDHDENFTQGYHEFCLENCATVFDALVAASTLPSATREQKQQVQFIQDIWHYWKKLIKDPNLARSSQLNQLAENLREAIYHLHDPKIFRKKVLSARRTFFSNLSAHHLRRHNLNMNECQPLIALTQLIQKHLATDSRHRLYHSTAPSTAGTCVGARAGAGYGATLSHDEEKGETKATRAC